MHFLFGGLRAFAQAIKANHCCSGAFAGLPLPSSCGLFVKMRRALLLLAFAHAAVGAEPPEALARFFSSEWRNIEEKRSALQSKLATLPPQPADQTAERIGWHSRYGGRDSKSPRTVAVDLGASESFDAVVLVPVNVSHPMYAGPGYGFPVRFRIEALDRNSGSLPITLADFTAFDFPNPGSLPVVIETPGARGRIVRVTSTRHFLRGDDTLFALGEVMVLRGGRNLAAGAEVETSTNYENAPAWQPSNATDSQTVLGPPIRFEPNQGHGYHSEIVSSADRTKFVQLDLGIARPLDEVRLHPARPNDFPPRRGFGFPVRFRVEADLVEDFVNPTVLFDTSITDFSNPGENTVTIPARGTNARFVRLVAVRLWERDRDFIFALGEMEIFSGGENVALGAKFSATDTLEQGRWSGHFINDGFTSQGRLLPLDGWLRGLSRRREISQQLAALDAARATLTPAVWRRIIGWSAAIVLVCVAVFVALAARRRKNHRRELARLRQRIAGDLHDEIGSNLGSIALLARLAADGPAAAKVDLAEIHRIARETADSMRDIVWLIQPGRREAADLVARMREVAAHSLADIEWLFDAEGVTGPFSLEFERQVFLLYKEALNNIRKHAHARRVAIRATQQGGEFILRITDDGAGFETTSATSGHGLASMQHRAGLIGGTLALQSKPAEGTQIELRARLA
jgi:signal transduction histidine kinase